MFPNRVPMDRNTPSPEPMTYLFIHSSIHVCLPESPKRSPPAYGEKYKVTVHGAPRTLKTYIQWGAAWFPKGNVNDTAALPQCHAASSRKLQRMLPERHKFYICIKYIQNTVWHCTVYMVSARHVSYIFYTNAKLEYHLKIFYVMSLNMAG
jgi:hypothetical protein